MQRKIHSMLVPEEKISARERLELKALLSQMEKGKERDWREALKDFLPVGNK